MKASIPNELAIDLARAVVQSDVQVIDQSSRHRVTTLQVADRNCRVTLKTARRSELRAALAHERSVLGAACASEALHEFLFCDDVESVPSTVCGRAHYPTWTLRAAYAGQRELPSRLWASLGIFAGTLHSQPVDSEAHLALVTPPWALGARRQTAGRLAEMSWGDQAALTLLQSEDRFEPLLAALAPSAHLTTHVHNDLKWDNVLVHALAGEAEPTQLKIVDWEHAGIGDPCWDIGTLFGEFLAFWALSIPIVDAAQDRYLHLARYPLEEMQPAIRTVWRGYAEEMGFDTTTARGRLIQSTHCAGARLIQTAFERTQTMTQLTPQIYLLLQLSLNIMEDPEAAVERLLGIPLPPTDE